MKKNALFLLLCLSTANSSFSQSTKTVTVNNLPADPSLASNSTNYTDQFTFFSFKTGKTVRATDSLTTKWDIGFKGTTIIVNGGKVRTGQGGIATSDTPFEQLLILSDTITFEVDSEDQLALKSGSGNGWYSYNMTTHELLPIKNRTLIIRTADGKYAKMEILSYYKDQDSSKETRYFTFRFNYQPNGLKSF